MKRTDAANNNNGQFQDANPATGVKGTRVEQSWLNSVQEEICSVIENEGGTLDANNQQQLWEAIRGMATPTGYLSGLETSLGLADPDHDITIAPGGALAENGNQFIQLDAAITKRLDSPWSPGDGSGGAASVSGTGTWFGIFLIWKSGSAIDAGFDSDANASNLLTASGYTHYRRIGWARTKSGAADEVTAFKQYGDDFFWKTPIREEDSGVGGGRVRAQPTGVSRRMAVPPAEVIARMNIAVRDIGGAVYMSSTDLDVVASTDISATVPGKVVPTINLASPEVDGSNAGIREIQTGSTGEMRLTSANSVDADLYISTLGWRDTRGK